ncbi:hypothetical protein LguiA_032915 [Lonicera macranthoides]
MVLALASLPTELDPVRIQILANPGVPTMDMIFEQLIRISAPLSVPSDSTTSTDSAILATQMTHWRDGNDAQRGRNRSRPKCTHCDTLGHTVDRCYKLHGYPSKVANLSQYDNMTVPSDDYAEFQKFRESKQSSAIASASQTGNHVACISQSSSIGP